MSLRALFWIPSSASVAMQELLADFQSIEFILGLLIGICLDETARSVVRSRLGVADDTDDEDAEN